MIVVYSTSVTALICHPLLMRMHTTEDEHVTETRWLCPVIPAGVLSGYECITCPIEREPAFSLQISDLIRLRSEAHAQVDVWMRAKGFARESDLCALVDPRSFRMYPIDMIASRHGKAYLIFLMHTRRRIPRSRHASALVYATEAHGVCVEQYAMSPTTIILNVYFKGQAEGGGTGVSAISRPTVAQTPVSSSRSHASSSEGGVAARRFLPTREDTAYSSSSRVMPALVVGGGGTGTTHGSVT